MARAIFGTHSSVKSNNWSCPTCSSSNPIATYPTCEICHRRDPLINEHFPNNESWQCSTCTFENRAQNTSCAMCDKKKSSLKRVNFNRSPSKSSMSLAVRDRRHNDESNASKVFQDIIYYCQQAKIHFVDDQFAPLARSVGLGPSSNVSQWLRISQIAPSSNEDRRLQWTVFSTPSPSDIQQGALGDCWLMAALSLITERPRMLEHILLTNTVNSEGVYLLRICHNGLWKTVILDDCFPCTQYKQLAFTQASRRQLYVPLIEKACAKLFGSYADLISGQTAEGLQLLTGAPCDHIHLYPIDDGFDGDIIWAKLLSACESQLLIGASTGRTDVSVEEYARAHIHGNHAFSVLAACAMDTVSLRFVLVRDPHARSTYTDELVTPEIFAQLRFVHSAHRSPGAFWISWPIFLRFFNTLTISTYVSDHYDVRETSKFTRSATQAIPTFHFYVPETSLVNISLLYHRRDRKSRNYHTQSFVLCNVEQRPLVDVGTREAILQCQRGAFTYWTGSLRPGHYVLIPFSTTFWQETTETNLDFTLVIHSKVQLDVHVINEPPALLADCLIAIALKHYKKTIKSHDAAYYATSDRSDFSMFIAENFSSTQYLNVDCDMGDATRIRHSRCSFVTHDSLPPRQRQLIFLTEWTNQQGETAKMSYLLSMQHVKQQNFSVPSVNSSQYDFHSPRPF